MKIQESHAKQLLIDFCEKYKKRDLSGVLALFTHNSNVWGSGLDEYRVGLKQIEEQLKRDWGQSDAGEIEIVAFVPTEKGASWAAAVCKAKITIANQEHVFDHFRGTITVEKETGAFKIAHMHASFPDYRNDEGDSFPAK